MTKTAKSQTMTTADPATGPGAGPGAGAQVGPQAAEAELTEPAAAAATTAAAPNPAGVPPTDAIPDPGTVTEPNAPGSATPTETTAPEGATPEVNYLADLQRLKAEFDNYRRRVKEQQHESALRATANLINQLLPVVDACEAALSAAGADDTGKLAELLLTTLHAQGLQAIQPQGEVFDPNIHEAIERIEPPAGEPASPEPVVAEVVRTGYFWQDKLLRPAMVKVKG